jgi:hypothetical protein
MLSDWLWNSGGPHYITRFERRFVVPKVKFAGYSVRVPGNPLLRIAVGILLIIGGLLWFLPVVGFWMLPLGIAVLSVDFPPIRRFRRRETVRIGYWLQRRWPRLARKIGYGDIRNGKR